MLQNKGHKRNQEPCQARLTKMLINANSVIRQCQLKITLILLCSTIPKYCAIGEFYIHKKLTNINL